MEILDLYKLHINKIFKKPNLSLIDIDINNEILDHESIMLPIFRAIYNDDFEKVKEYAEREYVESNLKRQTPLMLAAKLNNYKMVKLLLNESCLVDENQMSALKYAIKYNASSEVIDLLLQREK